MNKTVLLVDDDTLAREALATTLEDAGVEVLQASDGEEALTIATKDFPKLIVTDIHMPKMDGLAMINQLREHPEAKSIPVIILTVDEAPSTLNEALTAGVTVYLSKASADPQMIVDQIVVALG